MLHSNILDHSLIRYIDDWMNAPEPATIKDLIKHKVASEEKYSEKNKAVEQILAAPVTGSVSGQSNEGRF